LSLALLVDIFLPRLCAEGVVAPDELVSETSGGAPVNYSYDIYGSMTAKGENWACPDSPDRFAKPLRLA
jgi:hypothetical protein